MINTLSSRIMKWKLSTSNGSNISAARHHLCAVDSLSKIMACDFPQGVVMAKSCIDFSPALPVIGMLAVIRCH